ncbi:MAG: outer membrane beta-barrel protein [Cyanobacteria bacterium J06597_16]
MSLTKGLLGAVGVSLLALSLQLPSQAQMAPEGEVSTEAEQLAYPANADAVELAQARRRTRRSAGGSNFIGIGADFGSADDVTFAAISKFSLNNQVALRPSVLVGDDIAVLVPVTYEFNQFSTDVRGFQIRPYAGVGASYSDSDDDSNIGLLLSAGLDIPVSRRFTVNTQANYAGIFSDDENFGVTVGIGYNFGNGGR